ncbi:MAG TPA: hypothetical protein VKV29_14955 [Chthonomonas sp.]|jgi:hypothetical protein|uniref:hypothetical protein n=1 Tax=Chthonomonas sp. TaxID=2282153 RepID=UPI002B4B66AB|nr:hypothetical protein [Chthonomonas sp.]HLH81570.1 hypothetical protein [Chthonomonas sp.]
MRLEYLGLIGLGFILLPGLAGDRPKTFAVPPTHTATDRAPYAQWKYGPPATPNYFPIAVWLQSPENALKYKAAGFNLYVGLWQGPTEEQLSALRAAHMPVICAQNAVGLAHRNDPIIVGWMHDDEPDNAQPMVDPNTGKQSWGPCVPPERIVAEYERFRAADPTRPIMLNLGQGVANDAWYGRGPGAKLSDYETYVKGCDIVSFDVYPVAGLDRPDGENYLWYVAKGVERLVRWTKGQKVVWNCIECTRISGNKKATPHEVRAEVWMALIHGSRGLIYFVHQFKPTFDEHALLDDPPMLAAVTQINQQVHRLAPVLNSPTIEQAATVVSSSAQVPIHMMVKRYRGATYLFAVAMRNGATKGTFEVRNLPAKATAEVLGENRSISVVGGKFEDAFQPYDVHLYRIVASSS